ncbi:MAG TPA: carbon monoxide dehydrogenase subunit G [Anaerolineae bacterium]|nr:carbon monoxide dehydrogenase subunit G [Anaerolineae bacterium]
MHFEGTVAINAPRDKAWKFLVDPNAVSQCAPGLQSVEVIEPDQKFRAVSAVGFGSVKVTFKIDVTWLELDPPHRARMKAHGTAPGSATDIASEMVLADGPNGSTELTWSADVVVLGSIASLAARLMGSVTKTLVGAFFNCAKGKIEA